VLMMAGSMCGQGLAGYLGPSAGWRVPFGIIGAPGLAIAWAAEPAHSLPFYLSTF